VAQIGLDPPISTIATGATWLVFLTEHAINQGMDERFKTAHVHPSFFS
jgi:hypothetical protein